jgi:hypothetical protein
MTPADMPSFVWDWYMLESIIKMIITFIGIDSILIIIGVIIARLRRPIIYNRRKGDRDSNPD